MHFQLFPPECSALGGFAAGEQQHLDVHAFPCISENRGCWLDSHPEALDSILFRQLLGIDDEKLLEEMRPDDLKAPGSSDPLIWREQEPDFC